MLEESSGNYFELPEQKCSQYCTCDSNSLLSIL